MNDEQERVVSAMWTYGGSFVKRLSEAFRAADPQNFEKLKNAFPEYWAEYDKMSAPVEDTVKELDADQVAEAQSDGPHGA